MARIQLEPLRGFRDLLHPESTALSRLAALFAEEAERHGYEEVKPPTLERFEIFALKSGEEIRRSMYVFRDKAGREVALRPEATASVARIYLRLLRARPKPVRLYYVINCFRYEEPQRARYREFWQAGVENIGSPGVEGDFEVVKLLLNFYRRLGMLDKIRLKLGNTRIYRMLFSEYNVPEEVQDRILHLMDKKLYSQALEEAKRAAGSELASLLEKLWSAPGDASAAAEAVKGTPAEDAVNELVEFVDLLRGYDRSVKLDLDVSFARGLAYYTGIIFEVTVPGFPVSIAGGGRYDNLIAIYGDENVPGTGFAIGLDRTLAAMEELGIRPPAVYSEPLKAAVVALEPRLLPYAARVQDIVAAKGYKTSLELGRPGRVLSKLSRLGYRFALIIGGREAENRSAVLRDLAARAQVEISLDRLESLKTLEEAVGGASGES